MPACTFLWYRHEHEQKQAWAETLWILCTPLLDPNANYLSPIWLSHLRILLNPNVSILYPLYCPAFLVAHPQQQSTKLSSYLKVLCRKYLCPDSLSCHVLASNSLASFYAAVHLSLQGLTVILDMPGLLLFLFFPFISRKTRPLFLIDDVEFPCQATALPYMSGLLAAVGLKISLVTSEHWAYLDFSCVSLCSCVWLEEDIHENFGFFSWFL